MAPMKCLSALAGAPAMLVMAYAGAAVALPTPALQDEGEPLLALARGGGGYGGGWARPAPRSYYYRGWVRPAYRWPPGRAVAAGAALGFLTAEAAGAFVVAPAPGLCWYYTDITESVGFWDVCP